MSRGGAFRLACVRFPHLALVLAWRAHPELAQEAVLVGSRDRAGRMVVLAASQAALAMGAQPNQDWHQAELACPNAARLLANLAEVDRLRQELRLALYNCSPLVELTDDTMAYLDLSDRDARWATEAARASHLGREVQQTLLLPPALGVGQSRFVAWVAAQTAGPGRARLVPAGGAAEFLADWPVAELPLPSATRERLLSFGLRTCGDCVAIALPDLQRQLGPDGLRLHRLCLGLDQAAINPWRSPPPCGVRRVLAGVVEDTESLRFGAPELASGLSRELARLGLAATRLRLVLWEEDAQDGAVVAGQPGVFWEEISPPTPVATAEELLPPVLGLLSRARCRVLVIELQALDLVAPPAEQAVLWPAGRARQEEIGQASARLQDRFGEALVWRVAVSSGHPGDIPEERLVWRPA
ncbi:MAG: DNA polymerase Y family protein [Candidatus Dormibacteria bacterium]